MKDLAPIVLFVYNRPKHTLEVLESLRKNYLFSESTLYVFADGAKNESDVPKVEELEEIISNKKWCMDVNFIQAEGNQGLANSVVNGLSKVFEKFEKAIILEDDIVVSEHFLKYMNESLDMYQAELKVAGISGFTYPSEGNLDETYFLPIGCSWGWATWARSWENFQKDSNLLIMEIDKRGTKKKFDFGGYGFYKMLQHQAMGDIDSWAIRFYASFFLRDQFFLFPRKSFVKNIGFDDSGTNTKSEDIFFNTEKARALDLHKIKVELNERNVRSVRKGFEKRFKTKSSLLHRVLRKIRS